MHDGSMFEANVNIHTGPPCSLCKPHRA